MRYLSGPKPLLCHELVGREHELQALREALEQAARGQPQFVVLAGEAGVGKTKLCRVFVEESQAQQALVLFGQAIPQDQALPFGPFLDALRRYFSTASGRLALSRSSLLQANFAFLMGLLPELAPLFAAVSSPTFDASSPPVQQQQALFHRVLAGLQALVQDHAGPLLLVLEDLHWTDETSLELLAFLAQRLDANAPQAEPSTPLMILGTYRREALPESPVLSRLLVQLHEQRHASEMIVVPLSFSDHRWCLDSILEQPAPEQFAHLLFDWDEGNPFFLEELLEAMATSGQLQLSQNAWHISSAMRPSLPPSITTAILERFVRLPAVDQAVLSYAAVIGRIFDFPLLATLCQLGEPELAAVLRRAMNFQLISEVNNTQPFLPAHKGQERYQFRHALTREAIYEHMLAPERRLRHQRVAETLEHLETGVPPGLTLALSTAWRGKGEAGAAPAMRRDNLAQLLAEHYWLAGLPEKARPYALQEAERVSRLFAFREERYYLNLAQASLSEDSPERLRLLQRMGMLSLGIYDFAEALHWLNLAKTGYQRIGQYNQALQAMANLLLTNWFIASPSMPELLAEVESAAEAVFADPDPASRNVETLVAATNLAHYWAVHSLYTRAAPWIERCLALYEPLDDPRKVVAIQLTYITRAWFKAHRHILDFEEARAEMRQAIDLASQYSLPDVIMIGFASYAWLLIYWGRVDEAEQVLAEATELEERSGTLLPYFLLGWQRFFSGDQWEQGMNRLRQGIERLDQLHVSYVAAVARVALAHLLLTRNELAEAEMHLQAAQPALETNNEYIYLTPLWWGFARLLRVQGDLLGARVWYERILNRWKTTEDTFTILPIFLDGIVFYAETGNRVKARQWLAELEAVLQLTDNPVGVAALLEAQGVVHAREGKLKQAIAALRQAVEAWGKLKRGYQLALACQRLAEVLMTWASTEAVGRAARQAAREEADGLLDQALAVYERLQIPTGIQTVQALRSSTHLEAQHKRRRTLATRQPEQGLTQREMQVLSQLAAGRTNREIATALSLSEGTVELHVSHILAKLDCETRTQAAAYALAHGLMNNQLST
jgi:DNA-binding CsgD family transcriptional regulator